MLRQRFHQPCEFHHDGVRWLAPNEMAAQRLLLCFLETSLPHRLADLDESRVDLASEFGG